MLNDLEKNLVNSTQQLRLACSSGACQAWGWPVMIGHEAAMVS